jgi:pimeloyl-ACP methyl ester carboxylesterase
LCAAIALLWLAHSLRMRDVADATPESGPAVTVTDDGVVLAFLPAQGRTGLIFICGSAVGAEAYAPLLRPVAEAGFPVFIVNLPYRIAPLESHRQIVFDRIRQVIAAHPGVADWVLSGHSLGAALAAGFAGAGTDPLSGLVLIATTYPHDEDLSGLQIPVVKIYATNDGLVAVDKVLANKGKLPAHTRWIEIAGGNHSQFGRYDNQFVDGDATISREEQEALTRSAIIRLLVDIEARPR